MKNSYLKYSLFAIALLISLFIYTVYRTDGTLINHVFIMLFSREAFDSLRASVTAIWKLPSLIVYSLPEALWVFSITLTSKHYFLRCAGVNWSLMFLPLICCVGLEFLQLAGITNGHFDVSDISLSVTFWLFALLIPLKEDKKALLEKPDVSTVIWIISYAIVYLAHVY